MLPFKYFGIGNLIFNKNILKLIRIFLGLLFLPIIGFSQASDQSIMTWETVAELPSIDDVKHPGIAGCYAGISNNKMIIAGGANFPDLMPWAGGIKNWSDKTFVLNRNQDGYSWEDLNATLDQKSAYGASITISEGVLCIGGTNGDQELDDVFLMRWDATNNKVVFENYPSLPIPLAHLSACRIENTIYIGGGQSEGITTNVFYKLDLDRKNARNWNWEELPTIPGATRAFAPMVAQSNGEENGVFIFSGRSYDKSGDVSILTDGQFYSPLKGKWKKLKGKQKFPIMAGNAIGSGLDFIVLVSGADGSEFLKLISLEKEILNSEKEGNEENTKLLKQAQYKRLENHKGFSKDVQIYNTITNTLVKVAVLPFGVVTAPIVKWEDEIFVISGEIRPGVRTPKILKGMINSPTNKLSWINILVLIIYFVILIWMGYFFSKRQKDTNDYFKGGGRIPWWAAGLSIFGTGLSAITFMAIPAKAYATDWAYIWFNAGILLMAPVIIYFFIPKFRKLNISTAYEYLEIRFNIILRTIGSISFILFQIGRMAVVLFLPALAINVVTGIDIYTCILCMGILSLLYTLMGGIEAVIWTDAMQVVVLMGGAILCLVIMIVNIDGGFAEIVDVAIENNKFNAFNLEYTWTSPTLWVVLFGGYFTSLATYGSDQTMVQRYLTTADAKGATKSLLTNVWLTIPATILFFFVGTALFTFFKQHPQEMNFSLSNGDAIFPWYIVNELPNGIVGLLISGILAAAMSSVSSSINSAAASYTVDIHFRFWKPSNNLKIAKSATFAVGVLGTAVALFMAGYEIKSLWDVFNKVLGLILGSMSGLFLLGIFFKKANSEGAIIGFIGSLIVQIIVVTQTSIHLLLYTATGIISCVLIGYIASLIIPKALTKTRNTN